MSIFESLQSDEPIPRYQRRKLTPGQVDKIRDLYCRNPRPTQAALARNFGVSQPQISKIVNGLQWAPEEER